MFKPIEKKVVVKGFKKGKKFQPKRKQVEQEWNKSTPAKMMISTNLTSKRSTTAPDINSTSKSTSSHTTEKQNILSLYVKYYDNAKYNRGNNAYSSNYYF